jgi:hypothetical protein
VGLFAEFCIFANTVHLKVIDAAFVLFSFVRFLLLMLYLVLEDMTEIEELLQQIARNNVTILKLRAENTAADIIIRNISGDLHRHKTNKTVKDIRKKRIWKRPKKRIVEM